MIERVSTKLLVCLSIALVSALPLRAACGTPSFAELTPTIIESGAAEFAFGDVDGDGELDLVTVHTTVGNIHVRLGVAGAFGEGLTYPVPSPTEVALGDLDGDTYLDIIVASEPPQTPECVSFGSCAGVSVLLNDGDGTFANATTTPVAYAANIVAVDTADFDGDGNEDVLVGGAPLVSGDPALHALFGDGDGGFGSTHEWAVDGTLHDAAAAVLTPGSNQADVIALLGPGTSSTSTRVVTYASQSGTFPSISATRELSTVTSSEAHLATADFNDNGTLDIVVSRRLHSSPMDIWGAEVVITNGAGSLVSGGSYGDSQVGVIRDIAAADIDEDGDTDVVLVSGTSYWYAFRRQFQNFTNTTHFGLIGGSVTRVFAGDLTSDGRPDLAFLDPANDAVRVAGNFCTFRYVEVTLNSSPNPSVSGSAATFTVSVQPKPGAPMPEGTVALFEGDQVLGTAEINEAGNGFITLSDLSVGTHSLRAQLAATNEFDSAFSNTHLHTVLLPPFGPPPNVTATGNAAANKITVRWLAVDEAVLYEIRRRSSGAWVTIGSVGSGESFIDSTVNSSTAYVYTVRAHRGTGEISADSNSDIATTATILLPVDHRIRATDFTTTRTLVNSLRIAAGLSAFTFTDANLSGVKVKALHVTELRTALNQARTTLGFAALTFTRPTLTPGTTKVAAVDIQEIRNSLQ